jgi:hypothetical protein
MILLFGLLCLLAFWVSIPMPRADGSLLGSDGTYYYSYLPSVLLDGDLDFRNDYRNLMQGEPDKLAYSIGQLTPVGLPANHWSIGPAILWAPFFLLAQAVALGLGLLGFKLDATGYGMLHQAFALSGSILYGAAGLFLIYAALRYVVKDRWLLAAAVLTVTAGGSAVYYMTVEPHMSHAPSLFATGLFFWIWLSGRGRETPGRAAALGAAAGLMALIRPQDGLFLILPFIDRLLLLGRDTPGGERRNAATALVRDGVIAAACSLVVFAPQLVVWEVLWGTFLKSSYALEGEGFDWLRPRFLKVAFSTHRGLFVWHPVLLLSLLGLARLRGRDPRLMSVMFLGFLIQWYVVSSWWAWDQGKSFGGRMFIVCTPIFALGLALLLTRLRDASHLRVGLAAACLLVAANGALMIAYVLSW